MSEMTDAKTLADEYRPSMTFDVVHSWAAEAAGRLRGEGAQLEPTLVSYSVDDKSSCTLKWPDGSFVRYDEAQPEQQGQAVATVTTTSDRFCYGKLECDLPDGTKLYTRPQPVGGDAVRAIVSDIRHSAKVDDYEAPQIAFLESVADRLAALSAAPAAPETMTEGDRTAAQSRMIDELTAPAPVAGGAVRAEGIAQAVATELYGEPPEPGSNSLTRGMQLPRIRRAIEAALAHAQDRASQPEAAPGVPEGWPKASEEDASRGWTLDYGFLDRVTDLAQRRTDYTTSVEASEQVLIAALEVLAAAAPKPTAGEKAHG